MRFPPSRALPALLYANELYWCPPSARLRFWTGEDVHGTRWLIKLRGGFYAVRERAFSIIAQALEIASQSSTFLKMSPLPNSLRNPGGKIDFGDLHQLAIWFLDEHQHQQTCQNCPLTELNERWKCRPYDVDVLKDSRIANAVDLARGEMLGMLCEMHEPPGRLFTTDHLFVQIDNELMFSRGVGASLARSSWVVDEYNQIRSTGLKEAVGLCEQVLSLSEAVFRESVRLPAEYRPEMIWSVRREINRIQTRARVFLEWATVQRLGG